MAARAVSWTRLRGPLIVFVGLITPVGILAVNGAAFVMRHLVQFRDSIAAAALISSLLLNGIAAYSAVRFARRNAPLLFAEYRRWAIVGAVIVVGGTAAAAAYFTYVGMDDPRRLPDRTAILASVLALGVPFLITYVDRRYLRGREVKSGDEEHDKAAKPSGASSSPAERKTFRA